MSAQPHSIGLEIPRQADGRHGAFDLRPRKVEEWIRQLPLADVGESTRRIQAALSATNETSVSPSLRFDFLEQLREPVAYLARALESQINCRSFPLSERAQYVADQAQALFRECSVGHKVALVDILSGKRRVDKKLLAYCIHRALREMGRVLLNAYKIYNPPPRNVWREIHRLYRIAEQHNVAATSVRDPLGPLRRRDSIDRAYRHLLLLGLADPYRLRHGEVEQVYDELEHWAHHLSLATEPPNTSAETDVYPFRLSDDAPPNTKANTAETQDNTRWLNLGPLLLRLRRELSRKRSRSEGSGNLPFGLLRRLLITWGSGNNRRFSRSRHGESVRMGIGLNTAYHLIDGANGVAVPQPSPESDGGQTKLARLFPDPSVETQTEFSLTPIPEDRPHVWPHRSSDHSLRSPGGNLREPDQEQITLPEPAHTAQTWRALNVSAGGYCLTWTGETPSTAQVGELVGLKEGDDARIWNIGVIRWMQYLQNEGLIVGVQILGANANTLTGAQYRNKSDELRYCCLELPEIPAIHQPPTLLTPALHYRVGDTVVLDDHGARRSVQLTRQLENTGNFARFQFTPLDPGGRAGESAELGPLRQL